MNLSIRIGQTKPGPERSGKKFVAGISGARLFLAVGYFALAFALCTNASAVDLELPPAAQSLFKQFCFDCHSAATAEGQVNLEQMSERPAFNTTFKKWVKVAAIVQAGRMPPKDAEQPTAQQREQLVKLVREQLQQAAEQNAGDPG